MLMNEVLDEILHDKAILEKYAEIDKINPYPFSHGMKHILNVVALVDKIAPVFNLTKREVFVLKVCEILHDLGQVDGREKHGEKAAAFATDYLLKFDTFTGNEISDICSAIATHDEHSDYARLENKYSWFVNLIDKMDFSRDRLEDWCEKKFGYTAYQDIKQVDFALKNNTFIIYIKLIQSPKVMTEDLIYDYRGRFFNKVYYTAKEFCNHFGYKLDIKLNGKSLTLKRFEIGE